MSIGHLLWRVAVRTSPQQGQQAAASPLVPSPPPAAARTHLPLLQAGAHVGGDHCPLLLAHVSDGAASGQPAYPPVCWGRQARWVPVAAAAGPALPGLVVNDALPCSACALAGGASSTWRKCTPSCGPSCRASQAAVAPAGSTPVLFPLIAQLPSLPAPLC